MFSSSNRVKESMLANNDQDSIMYQVEYTMDKSSKDGWKRSQQRGSKGHVRIKGLLPARLYFARARSQNTYKQWSKYSEIFSFVTRDYSEKEEVLVHGEGPWEKDAGFYPAVVLKVLKPGEYYSDPEGGRGSGSPLFTVTQSRNWKLARNCMHTVVLVGFSLVLEEFHIDHESIAKEKYQKKIRSMSQQDLFQHRHEDTNHYLFLEGLPHGSIVQTSKVDIRPNRAVSGGPNAKRWAGEVERKA